MRRTRDSGAEHRATGDRPPARGRSQRHAARRTAFNPDRKGLSQTIRIRLSLTLLGVLVVAAACRSTALWYFEKRGLTTDPNGNETPATLSIPFVRVDVPSGPRELDWHFVSADEVCGQSPMIVIYHGIGETISD